MFKSMGKIYTFLLFSLAWCAMAPAHAAPVKGVTAASPSEIKHAEGRPMTAIHQGREISGKVTEEDGTGLPGVSVLIEGTTDGTVTDNDGNFKIIAPSGESVLIFSFIGYVTQKVTVGTRSSVDIALVPDVTSLAEVVVTGYSTQKRATLTGA